MANNFAGKKYKYLTSEAAGQQMSLPKAYKQNWDFLKGFVLPPYCLIFQSAHFLWLLLGFFFIFANNFILRIGYREFHKQACFQIFVKGVQKSLPDLPLV